MARTTDAKLQQLFHCQKIMNAVTIICVNTVSKLVGPIGQFIAGYSFCFFYLADILNCASLFLDFTLMHP